MRVEKKLWLLGLIFVESSSFSMSLSFYNDVY